jgi:APA family basic amino acid/polyamine antiporter
MPLLRILGVAFGVAVVIGGSIGVGILRAPGTVAGHAGSPAVALLLWAAGGVYALVAAICLAELATSIPRSGGFYAYAHRALGPGFGFAVGWADWISNCSSISYAAVVVGEYAAALRPSLRDDVPVVAAAVTVGFAALQAAGLRVSARVQEVASFVKAAAFVSLILAIAILPASGAAAAAAAPARAFPGIVAAVLALQLVLTAYDGWQMGAYFAGEDRDPARNLPRSILGGVLIVMAVYLLMNLALVRVLPMAVLSASLLPAADAAQLAMGAAGETVVRVLAILSGLSLISAVMLSAPRILYAMAADGLVSSRAAFVDARGTPAVALACSTAAALALLAAGGFEAIATVFAVFAVTSYTGAFVSLLVLRRREPALPRPFRTWGYPWTVLVALAGAAGLLVGIVIGAPREGLMAAAALAASYPVYRLTRG